MTRPAPIYFRDKPETLHAVGEVLPAEGFIGGVWDCDEYLTHPLIQSGPFKGQRLYEMARILASHEIAIELKNEFLYKVNPAISREAYVEATHPTTFDSLVMLLHWAGQPGFESKDEYDPNNEVIRRFMALRQKHHLLLLQDYVSWNVGARELLEYTRDETNFGNAIASMAPKEEMDIMARRLSFEDYMDIDRIFTVERAKEPKPHPDINNLAFDSLGTPRDDFETRRRIIGGDDSAGGTKSISAARMTAVGIRNREPEVRARRRFSDSRALIVARNPGDVVRIMKMAKAKRAA
ncbi:MAG: HAD hydrolase-like protein [Candidatus Saccharimonadales bacterium]|nr:HAD family phosphatase [Candidatus Saccharibacteria bacterium]